jgi:Xaa-Pro aminopeptidase
MRRCLNHVRRAKDEAELARMREAERVTSAGFAAVAPLPAPGRTEREIQLEVEAEFFRQGGDFLAFETIVAGGPNTAVLHFAPTARPLGEGELVLIDAGAEYMGYASDITRTYRPRAGSRRNRRSSTRSSGPPVSLRSAGARREQSGKRCTGRRRW